MRESYVTIPLNQPDPARQRLWRAAWLIALAGLGVILGTLVYRTFLFRNHNVAWPDSAVIALRLPKTPENLADSAIFLRGLLVSQNFPANIYSEYLRAHNEIILFLNQDGEMVGFATDRAISSKESLFYAGYQVSATDSGNLSTLASEPTTKHRVFTPWYVWPQFDGALSWRSEDKISTSPVTLTNNSLTFRGNFATYEGKSQLSLGDTTPLASLSAPSGLASALLPDVPAVFPGLQTLTKEMERTGFSLRIGQDTNGLAYAFSLENSTFSPENLGEITEELVQVTSLSKQDWTIGLTTYEELRGSEVNVDISHDADLNRVIASNGQHIVRATQSEQTVILSNRQPEIGQSNDLEDPCLASATSFLAPSLLRQLLPPATAYQTQGLEYLLQQSTRVSWSESVMKVCW